jgi:hypothetical protein
MATILYVVGSQVLDFPTKQAERVAHCYIGMLLLSGDNIKADL